MAITAARREAGVFLAEGSKLAAEWLSASGGGVHRILGSETWFNTQRHILSETQKAMFTTATPDQLAAITSLQSAPEVIIIAEIPAPPQFRAVDEWCILIDELQDPGNVGTILRIADWFGIPHVLATPGCADFFSPKVVQAAMGAHLRVAMYAGVEPELCRHYNAPVFAAVMDGDSLSDMPRQAGAMLMIGNESRGLSTEWMDLATHKVTIERRGGAESLNAAVAAGIICAALR